MIIRFLQDERGATAIEYGLIAVCLSLVVTAAVGVFATSMEDMMIRIRDTMMGNG